ncbi:MAG: NAD kinase [Bacteroidales bacterium]
MKVAIYGRKLDISNDQYINQLIDVLRKYHFEIFFYDVFFNSLKLETKYASGVSGLFNGYKDIRPDIDCLISIGGDGTFLDTLALVQDTNIPVIGINYGKLGFLASISKEDDIENVVKALHEKKYSIERRSLLQVESQNGTLPKFNKALNDMTIQKKESQMITVHVYLDGEFLNSYWADGLIIATPTGSTAYSLSVGGPILLPQNTNYIISPISPHNLTIRPIVVPDDCEITLNPEGRSTKYLVTMDHRSEIIKGKISLKVFRADYQMNVIRLQHSNFYNTLRNKLMWGIDRRN